MRIEISSILGFVILAECGADRSLLAEWSKKGKAPVFAGSSLLDGEIEAMLIEFHVNYMNKVGR